VSTRRRVLRDGLTVVGIGMLAAYGCVPPVERRSKIPRLGFVSPASRDRELFGQALRGIGYLEGQSIALESRTAGESDEQLTPAIEELVRLPADIIGHRGEAGYPDDPDRFLQRRRPSCQ